ncbi:hypothetical protein NPIL_527371 [Nephila pilipes]|uniref:Secreted protein n=1 Tax=Nephila pilipes TaxID=299642 RepID=A0A8X6QBI6_NEPPI|nr:hypothetical protein NPIL_527371 [Nephila pilipes]
MVLVAFAIGWIMLTTRAVSHALNRCVKTLDEMSHPSDIAGIQSPMPDPSLHLAFQITYPSCRLKGLTRGDSPQPYGKRRGPAHHKSQRTVIVAGDAQA